MSPRTHDALALAIPATPVVWQKIPLVGEPQRYWAPEGLTLLEIIESVPSLPPYFLEVGILCINGEPVPREYWDRVRPRAGNCSVTLHVELHGGGSGGTTKILTTVLTLAIIVAAAVLGPIGAGALAGAGYIGVAGTASFLATQAAISAAIAIGGALLVSALAPPPSLANSQSSSSASSKSIKSASLQGNTIGPGDA